MGNLSWSFCDQAIPELIQGVLGWLARFDVLGCAISGFHLVGIVDVDTRGSVSEIDTRQLEGHVSNLYSFHKLR